MRNLYIYGENPDLSRIKDAKASLGLDYLVKPADAYGQDWSRVLTWGAKPPFLCDYALVGPETSPDGLIAALRWVLEGDYSPAVTTIEDTLTNIFGFGVKELDSSETAEYDKIQNLKKASVRFKLQEKGDSHENY